MYNRIFLQGLICPSTTFPQMVKNSTLEHRLFYYFLICGTLFILYLFVSINFRPSNYLFGYLYKFHANFFTCPTKKLLKCRYHNDFLSIENITIFYWRHPYNWSLYFEKWFNSQVVRTIRSSKSCYFSIFEDFFYNSENIRVLPNLFFLES
jgi:hypothetical protein